MVCSVTCPNLNECEPDVQAGADASGSRLHQSTSRLGSSRQPLPGARSIPELPTQPPKTGSPLSCTSSQVTERHFRARSLRSLVTERGRVWGAWCRTLEPGILRGRLWSPWPFALPRTRWTSRQGSLRKLSQIRFNCN